MVAAASAVLSGRVRDFPDSRRSGIPDRLRTSRSPGQRSFGSVLGAFIDHKGRKDTFNLEGRTVRRCILVRCRNNVAFGKEANRVEDSRVLGLRMAGGRAKTYVDPDPFKGSATEVARRLGVSRRTIFSQRRNLRRRGS